MVFGNDNISGLSSKANQPLYLTPSLGWIFATVRIAASDYDRIPTITGHHFPEGADSLCVNVFHDTSI
jgi:hypothetical protein